MYVLDNRIDRKPTLLKRLLVVVITQVMFLYDPLLVVLRFSFVGTLRSKLVQPMVCGRQVHLLLMHQQVHLLQLHHCVLNGIVYRLLRHQLIQHLSHILRINQRLVALRLFSRQQAYALETLKASFRKLSYLFHVVVLSLSSFRYQNQLLKPFLMLKM